VAIEYVMATVYAITPWPQYVMATAYIMAKVYNLVQSRHVVSTYKTVEIIRSRLVLGKLQDHNHNTSDKPGTSSSSTSLPCIPNALSGTRSQRDILGDWEEGMVSSAFEDNKDSFLVPGNPRSPRLKDHCMWLLWLFGITRIQRLSPRQLILQWHLRQNLPCPTIQTTDKDLSTNQLLTRGKLLHTMSL